jgi:hypothetical protein
MRGATDWPSKPLVRAETPSTLWTGQLAATFSVTNTPAQLHRWVWASRRAATALSGQLKAGLLDWRLGHGWPIFTFTGGGKRRNTPTGAPTTAPVRTSVNSTITSSMSHSHSD